MIFKNGFTYHFQSLSLLHQLHLFHLRGQDVQAGQGIREEDGEFVTRFDHRKVLVINEFDFLVVIENLLKRRDREGTLITP